ncbi:MAG TPA: type II toxin-antitoxin system PemK/MazF family toxin [Chthoniobacteraceae bacterium]|jgi:mRNA interferase MazF|nr:type II toxin-antitoxin system PemK/MazF family toxin [Chthoniobacteraceae bacterium]
MNEGDVVLAAFPQADGRTKNRPAIVLRVMPPFGDFLVCGVSRQLRHEVAGFDDVIARTDADFGESGLLDSSLVRLGFLALLPASEFLGDIGAISTERHYRLLKRLANYLLDKGDDL